MKKNILGILNLSVLAFGLMICFVNLNARVTDLENRSNELQIKIEEYDQRIEKIEEKNKMQDVILNKLNAKYNLDVSEELQEIADRNGVGG